MSSRTVNANASPAPGVVGPDAYAQWRETTLGAVTEALEHRLVHELIGVVEGKRVLDLGCGDGLLTCALAARGAHAVGIDADRRMLVAAQSRAGHASRRRAFVESRVENLPFPDGVFDVVVAVTVLCFVPNPSLALREAVRVLRPGGRLVIGELGRWNAWAARRRIRAWLGSQLWKAARFRTAGELRSLVERAGIAVVAVRGAVYYPPVGWIARILAPADRWPGALTTVGAAFIGVAGAKRDSSTNASHFVYFVYIVRCADGTLYTGYARDPDERANVHNDGRGAKYTARRLPVSLVYTEKCESLSAALKREHQLKRWTRKKKEALIAGDAALLNRL